jgi:DNA-binding transcriptional LysR family regulator
MNLRFVEAYYWVATLKSVSRAGDKLYLTQSAMSARIAALERELGVLLLDRRDKQFRLTVAGTRFLTYAERLLAVQREARAELGQGRAQSVALRIGAIESVLHSWLIPWVNALRVERPGLELELTVETTPVLAEQLRRGTLDIVFAALPAAGDGVRSGALPSMPMVFVGHRALHRQRRWLPAQIAAAELLTFQRGSQPHVALLDVLRSNGAEPRRVHTISSISAMAQLVEGGFGIATLPHAAALRLAAGLPLKVLNVALALTPLPIHVSYRADPANAAIEEVVQRAFAFIGFQPARGTPRLRDGARAGQRHRHDR